MIREKTNKTFFNKLLGELICGCVCFRESSCREGGLRIKKFYLNITINPCQQMYGFKIYNETRI